MKLLAKAMFAASKYTDAMAALAALAEEGDEDAKKAMKKMLTAAKAEDKPAPADDKDGDEDKKAQAARAAAEEDEKKAQAARSASAGEVSAMAEIVKLRNEIAEGKAQAERSTLLASRPDLTADPKMSAMLARMPLESLRDAVATIPVAKLPGVPAVNHTQGNPEAGQTAEAALQLRQRMGLEPVQHNTVTHGPRFQAIFGGSAEQIALKVAESESLFSKGKV